MRSPIVSTSPTFDLLVLAVAKVAKTFGDSLDGPKLLTSYATAKFKIDEALVCTLVSGQDLLVGAV